MKSPLRVLLIEDSPDDAELVALAIADAGFQPTVAVIDSEDGFRERACEEWDLVISDYALPGFGASRALELLHELALDAPFIVVSGCLGEETAVELMRRGAADCVHKDNLARLGPAISRSLEERDNRLARLRAEQELTRLAYFDELTGLPNRRRFKELLQAVIERSSTAVGVIVLHCERLRVIGDTLGEGAGEALLREAAERLQGSLPAGALLGQMDCTEFAIAAPSTSCNGDWSALAKHICSLFQAPFVIDKRELFLSPALGISLAPDNGDDVDALLRGARAAMRRARASKAGMEFYTAEIEKQGWQRLLVSNRLRGALQREEFELHYQPKVALTCSGATGFEALLRWHDAELGAVSPVEFIPAAEESGEIIAIGEWVLHRACRQIAEWRNSGLGPVKVAINVSARQLRDPGFVDVIRDALTAAAIPASALELEITESDIMADTELAVSILSSIRAMGVHISVDDFGTGYSSLAYLKKLPLSALKIDRSFISDVPLDADSCALVEAIIGLSHVLGLSVVAEGVETQQQVQYLLEQRCDEAQGFLFSHPLSAEETTRYLQQRQAPGSAGDSLQPAFGFAS